MIDTTYKIVFKISYTLSRGIKRRTVRLFVESSHNEAQEA